MGPPRFQVSGDGIHVGFQDFKSLLFLVDFLVLGPKGRSSDGGGTGEGWGRAKGCKTSSIQGRGGDTCTHTHTRTNGVYGLWSKEEQV